MPAGPEIVTVVGLPLLLCEPLGPVTVREFPLPPVPVTVRVTADGHETLSV